MTIRTILHATNPYDGFVASSYPHDCPGWNSDSAIFGRLIQEKRPRLIIEVGTWYGRSAIHMASILRANGIDGHVLATDTFLGIEEAWTTNQDEFYPYLHVLHGRPTVYEHFLANVCHAGLQDYITPFPQTSHNAARIFAYHGIRADLIYLDASHEEWDVERDIHLYATCLAPGGILFGDDYNRLAISLPVQRYANSHGGTIHVYDDGVKFVVRGIA